MLSIRPADAPGDVSELKSLAASKTVRAAISRGPFLLPAVALRLLHQVAIGLAAVAVRVTRQGALDVMPTIAHGTLCFAPCQARVAPGSFPGALEVGFDIIELAAAVCAVPL